MIELLFAILWVMIGGVAAPYLIMVSANRNYLQLRDVPAWAVLAIIGPVTAVLAALTFVYEFVDMSLPRDKLKRRILPW